MAENIKKLRYPLNRLYFYLTEYCNLRCCHCWIDPKYQTSKKTVAGLNFKLFTSIIKQAKPLGLSAVKLTGGEPLLHSKIRKILKFLREESIAITIETNGVLCTDSLAKEIAKGKKPFVGISLDSASPEIHDFIRGVRGSFNGAIQGIKNLVNCGIRPQIIMTIMQKNKGEIENVLHLAESLNAESVKFNIVQPTARGKTMHNNSKSLDIEQLIKIGSWVESFLSKKTNLRIIYDHPLAFRPLNRIFGNKKDGCSLCGILGILGVLSDGSYALCGIGQTTPELVFGNAAKNKLKEVWKNNPLLSDLRSGLPEHLKGVCKQCVMKNICLGSCIAQNYYNRKDLWGSYWYCQEAYDSGLFPETRLNLKKSEVAV